MRLTAVLAALLLAACSRPPAGHVMETTGPAPLLDGLGNFHHAVTTSNPQAQRYFDQGLTLVYGFNHEEAARSFRYAAQLDPNCGMVYWGLALAVGPNYNEPDVDLSRQKSAVEAIAKAHSASEASAAEHAYIDALAKRYSADPKADRKQLALAYKSAMNDVMHRFPDDLDAAVLFADSAMDLNPWQLWKPDGSAQEGTAEILAALESVLKRDPNHLGANHLYIHATEASPHPEKALASANVLPSLAPAAGHLVHMPAHTYIRMGEYNKASDANQRAAEVDQAYFRHNHAGMMYAVMYYSHNLHFLAVTASMEGRYADADAAASRLVAEMTPLVKDNPMAEWYLPTRMLVLVRARQWSEIEKLSEPPANLKLMHAFWRFAHGMATNSAADRAALARETNAFATDLLLGFNPVRKLLEIAGLMLNAKLNPAQAVPLLTKAAQLEDSLNYDEPPDWYLPPRESLGAAQFRDRRYEEAEATFRKELAMHPKNPRALFGLSESLRVQHKADSTRKDFDAVWKGPPLRIDDL